MSHEIQLKKYLRYVYGSLCGIWTWYCPAILPVTEPFSNHSHFPNCTSWLIVDIMFAKDQRGRMLRTDEFYATFVIFGCGSIRHSYQGYESKTHGDFETLSSHHLVIISPGWNLSRSLPTKTMLRYTFPAIKTLLSSKTPSRRRVMRHGHHPRSKNDACQLAASEKLVYHERTSASYCGSPAGSMIHESLARECTRRFEESDYRRQTSLVEGSVRRHCWTGGYRD